MIGNPLKISHIISEIGQGGIYIPELQRSYVWSRSQMAKLLDSIFWEYPTGSILLWDTAQEIRIRDLKTDLGKGTRSDFIPKIVLDGQQRLTSLARVFDKSTPKQDRILFNVTKPTF